MIKILKLLMLSQLICSLTTDFEEEFKKYCKKFNKTFATEQEREFRFNIFKENFKEVEKSNSKMSGLHGEGDSDDQKNKDSFQTGINKFSDMTDEEFENQYLMKPDIFNPDAPS